MNMIANPISEKSKQITQGSTAQCFGAACPDVGKTTLLPTPIVTKPSMAQTKLLPIK